MTEHQNQDGTLKPPTSQQSTDLPVEALTQPQEIKRLTLDEADAYRANKAFNEPREPLPEWFLIALNNNALSFSNFIIKHCPEGKERSQALGQVHAALLWAQEAGVRG